MAILKKIGINPLSQQNAYHNASGGLYPQPNTHKNAGIKKSGNPIVTDSRNLHKNFLFF